MAEKEYIEREYMEEIITMLKSEKGDIRVMDTETLLYFIRKVPAADVAPVRHGRWISLDDYFEDAQCSECGDALVIGDCSFNDFCECYNYCPNCGAKMDGGEEND